MRENDQQPGDTAGDHSDRALRKLKGSVLEYASPFEPVGMEEWEAVLLDDLTPETAHADEIAIPTLTELGEGNRDRR
ncbi:hypothetical protein R5M92_03900 [Halomonas sp. Bachu 37]|uniref:hypothetical protein n=1 Tax=Halomonas kashgarensis TaxID=3084920 RepID=UPI003217746A